VKTLIIPASGSLIEEVVRQLGDMGRDYSSAVVVFPGKRPSHFIRKSLAAKIKDGFIPPGIFSMDEFVDSLPMAGDPGRKLETIDAVSILYRIHVQAGDRLGGEGFMTPDSFLPIGLKLYRDIEELCIEGVPTGKVRDIQPFTDEAIPEQTVRRLQSLAYFYEEFYKTVKEERFSTRSLRYRGAGDNLDGAGMERYRKIILGGFSALTSSEKDLFRRLVSMDNTLLIFQDGIGIRDMLRSLDADYREAGNTAPVGPEVHFYRSPDTHGQVYALSRVLDAKREAGMQLDEKTAIVLPTSETLFPLLRQGLSNLGDDGYNVSMGYPLHRTPVFGFLNNLMELISSMDGDRVYVPAYLKFVLHPYTKNLYFHGSAEVTRILFHVLEEELTRNRTKIFLPLSLIEGDDALFRRVMEKMPDDGGQAAADEIRKHLASIHRNTVERFLSFENIGDFAARCGGLLNYIFENSTARLHPLFHPFAESFMRALDVISGSLMKDMAFTDKASYFTFFRRYVMGCHTPFEGTPVRGLQVLGFLETRGLSFDTVFILDANEEVLPDTKKEDSMLPFGARKALGLPTYKDRDRLAAHYFSNLTSGAKEVHLFFIESDAKERSRFVERLLWEREKAEKTTDGRRYIKPIQYRVKLGNEDPGDIAKTEDVARFLEGFTYSATALDTYLRCPLGFYYAYVLGIDRKEELSGEIERSDIGRFVHRVISAYFSKRKGVQLGEKDMDPGEMERLTDALFEEEYGKQPAGALYLLRLQIRQHLRDLVEKYYTAIIRERSLTILESECGIRGSFGPYKLKGRLDSIEKRDGRICIIDFKTGSNAGALRIDLNKVDAGDRDSWHRAIRSLQLPFYLLLYSTEKQVPAEEIDAMFLLLGRSVIGEGIELPLFSAADPAPAYGLLKDIIMDLLREITDASVPFRPSPDKKRTCPDCAFRYICGTQWIGR